MKKINNNLPRGGAEWGRALRRFLSDNIVPIMFVLICAYCIPRADSLSNKILFHLLGYILFSTHPVYKLQWR